MGMTDRQFDSYQSMLLDALEEIHKEIKEKGCESERLTRMIKKIKSELKRP